MSESSSTAESGLRQVTAMGEISICYRVLGTQGPLICVLPSVGRDTSDLEELAAALCCAGCTVLLPEPRGAGGSVGPLLGLRLEELAADVARVIEAAGRGPAVVAGHAYGGMVAGLVAGIRPDLVVGLVLIAYGGPGYPDHLGRMIDKVSSGAVKGEQARAILKQTFFVGDHGLDGWLDGWNIDMIASQRQARLRTGVTEGWGGTAIPVLDLIAADDPFRPAEMVELVRSRLGDRVTVCVVGGARHGLPSEKPQETATEIVSWMSLTGCAAPQAKVVKSN